jgi:hypothetical protein
LYKAVHPSNSAKINTKSIEIAFAIAVSTFSNRSEAD